MWNDFQIGSPVCANTAVLVTGYSISHNQYEYWWRSPEYDIGGKINKNSEVGNTITRMIYGNVSPKDLEAFVLRSAMTAMSHNTLIEKFMPLRERAFEAGRQAKVAEIRHCLDL